MSEKELHIEATELAAKAIFFSKASDASERENIKEPSGQVLESMKQHKILSLISPLAEEQEWTTAGYIQRQAGEVVKQSYRLLFLTKSIVELFEEAGIPAAVLKGPSIAADYPVPELRKSGDIDLLIGEEDLEKAASLLQQVGIWQCSEQLANHHVVFHHSEGIEIELHVDLTEEFDHAAINRILREKRADILEQRIKREIMGITLPVLRPAHQGLSLLLHTLQHYLRAGFGLKLLCDWSVFWSKSQPREEQLLFIELIKELGLYEYGRAITSVCVTYLGLSEERLLELFSEPSEEALQRQLLEDVFEAEEFGKGNVNRMVTLRDHRVIDYLREFHYQMKLTYPRASRNKLLYPVLWCALLVGFLWRNHKLHRGSAWGILRNAKKRSILTKKLHLFQGVK